MIRDSSSRPSSSVPSRCSTTVRQDGVEVGRRRTVRRDPRREDGDDDEAENDDQPGDRQRPPQEALAQQRAPARRGRAGASTSSTSRSRHADPRVEQRVDDVDEQVDEDVADRGDEHHSLDERVVPLLDRVDRQPAEAGDPEDRSRSSPRRRSSAPSCSPITVVTVIRLLRSAWLPTTRRLAQPLGARRPDVVRAERVEHRRAHLPHQHRAKPGAEDDAPA